MKELLSLLPSTVCASNSKLSRGKLPHLRILGFDWFPEWTYIQEFIERSIETHGSASNITLRLPKRPGRPVLGAIVQLLNGATPDIPLPREPEGAATVGCQYCARVGWQARADCHLTHGQADWYEPSLAL